jgi:prolyl oligopeptidase
MGLTMSLPPSRIDKTVEFLHGVEIADPYRWLEDQASPETREWLQRQQDYCRSYLDRIPGRDIIARRIRELLDIAHVDSLQYVAGRFIYRKHLAGHEQACIFVRDSLDGEERLLIDPTSREEGDYISVTPLVLSPDGSLLLYELKRGGERSGTFEIVEIASQRVLADKLEHGLLRGFAFGPGNSGFYYSLEPHPQPANYSPAVRYHRMGTSSSEDREIFSARTGIDARVCLLAGDQQMGILVYRLQGEVRTDFYLKGLEVECAPQKILSDIDYFFGPALLGSKVLALTNHNAPNLCIGELRRRAGHDPEWHTVVPEAESRIQQWLPTADRIFVCYAHGGRTQISSFDHEGRSTGDFTPALGESVLLMAQTGRVGEILLQSESVLRPHKVVRYCAQKKEIRNWESTHLRFASDSYRLLECCYPSRDGTEVPMTLVGRDDVLAAQDSPAIMTAYGGYGLASTPRFSVLLHFLLEHGCLFALPGIRGGGEFGTKWHEAARRRNRPKAIEDFVGAAEWLIASRHTSPGRLAIFGGSNGGLLVAAAMTQRPDLFRAVLCLNPLLDMLRYHLFDDARVWCNEFGCASDPEDFVVLRGYSPYHNVREGVAYPATMIVSGDADTNCNALHARKMIARLQACNVSGTPILLDYSPHRGHSPVLPLSERIRALTDRVAFVCEQLNLPIRLEDPSSCHSS